MAPTSSVTIPIELAEPGMILAVDVFDNYGALLLSEGAAFSSREQIANIKLADVQFVTVQSSSAASGKRSKSKPKAAQAKQRPTDEIFGVHPMAAARSNLMAMEEQLRSAFDSIASGKGPPPFIRIIKIADEIRSLEESNQDLVPGMLPESRDPSERLCAHSVNVCALCASFTATMGMEDLDAQMICAAALLHDVGIIPILRASETPTGPPGFKLIEALRKHPEHTKRIMESMQGVPQDVKKIAFQHHERLDGSGYPVGLTTGHISESALLVGLADYYCDLLTGWPDREPLAPYHAMQQAMKDGARLFGPNLMKRLVQIVGIYPVGTVVRLSNDELATVMSVNRYDYLNPDVAAIFNRERVFLQKPDHVISLAEEREPAEMVSIRACADLADFGIDYFDWLTGAVT